MEGITVTAQPAAAWWEKTPDTPYGLQTPRAKL